MGPSWFHPPSGAPSASRLSGGRAGESAWMSVGCSAYSLWLLPEGVGHVVPIEGLQLPFFLHPPRLSLPAPPPQKTALVPVCSCLAFPGHVKIMRLDANDTCILNLVSCPQWAVHLRIWSLFQSQLLNCRWIQQDLGYMGKSFYPNTCYDSGLKPSGRASGLTAFLTCKTTQINWTKFVI